MSAQESASIGSATVARRLLGERHAYGEIFALLSTVQPKGLCLDLPSGEGANFAGIASAGFRPVAADVEPRAAAEGSAAVPAVKADWYAPLPFADGSFDAVLCSEGIEHHAAQTEFLRELARVLRPGGTLLLTTPNILSLGARFSHLLNGHPAHDRSPLTEVTQIWRGAGTSRPYVGHAHLVSYFALRYMLWSAGLRVESVATARWSRNSVLLAPLLWLPVSLGTRRILRELRDRRPEVRAEILAHVLSPSLMLGKKLILLARKAPREPQA